MCSVLILSDVHWWIIDGRAYHFNANKKKTWYDVQTYCNDINASPLALETEEEFNRIREFINSTGKNDMLAL